MSDDLKSFKIQSKVGQRVDRPSGAGTKSGKGEAASVGFPRVEAIVEADSADLSGLGARHAQLAEMAKSGSAKEKAAAQKAAVAYERAQDLLEHLLSIKAGLQGGDGK